MLGVFLDKQTVGSDDLDFSSLNDALPEWRYYDVTPDDHVAKRVAGAQVVVSNKALLTADVLEKTRSLQLVCVAATGTNNVDVDTAEALGVTVCNVRAYATSSVAQHVFTLILALSRKLLPYNELVRQGQWQKSENFCLLDYPISDLAGKTMGIVGYGELGHAVSNLAKAFGMEVLIARRPATIAIAGDGRLPLDEILPVVDVLSLHCPLTDQTRGLIDDAALATMKSEAILINTARGGIVDEGALATALREGRLGGAGVDVLTTEPPKSGNKLLTGDIPNLIVTPHIAWASRRSRQRLIDEVAKNITAYVNGEPRNKIV